MKVYCGTDIIEVARVKEAIEHTKEFKENIYSKEEIEKIDRIQSDMKYQRYAGRFAAKEAVYKAMSEILIKHKLNISFVEIEVINQEELSNRPKVNILNLAVAKYCEENNVVIDVSISHVCENAIAMAVVNVDKE